MPTALRGHGINESPMIVADGPKPFVFKYYESCVSSMPTPSRGHGTHRDLTATDLLVRLRFTIRDLLTIVAILALAIGWWADHRRMDARVNSWITDYLKLEQMMLRYHEFRANRTTALLTSAQMNPPPPEVTAEVIDTVRHDPDWSIKVRAMAILPFVREREQAIDALIDATKDRDDKSSGSGNVPLYAGTYLAEMKATRGIDALADWVAFVKTQWPYETDQKGVLRKSQQDLDDLKAAIPLTKESDGR